VGKHYWFNCPPYGTFKVGSTPTPDMVQRGRDYSDIANSLQ
jgi:hypothetical protein